MVNTWTFDLEANGFVNEATKVHCGVFQNMNTGEVKTFEPHQVHLMLRFMDTCTTLIGHNTIGYDFPLLKKLYDYEYKGTKIDTVLMSRLQRPDRTLPFNCPDKTIKPHSVAAWGYRVGRGKVEHNDWEVYTPEMLHRCVEDVAIQVLIYHELLKEGADREWTRAHMLNVKLFEILQKQEDYGWLVDRKYMDRSIHLLSHFIRKIDAALAPKLPLTLIVEEANERGERKYIKKPFLKSGAYSQSVEAWRERHGMEGRIVVGPFSRINYLTVDLSKGVQTKEFLLREGWIPDKWNYKKEGGKLVKDDEGKLIPTSPKLSHEDSFFGIKSGVGKLIAKRVQASHRRSNIEGWIKLIRPDGRIASRVSGMASTSRLKHAGIVNVPGGDSFFGKQMRSCFIVKEGFKIVGTDSEGCQLRMLAARMGDAEYMDVIVKGDKDKGTDMHTTNMKAAGLHSRAQAKTFIYGFLFGAGDAKIGDIVGGGAKEGKALKEKFLQGLPALGALVEKLTAEWRSTAKTRQVKTKWGWRTDYYDGWLRGLDGRPITIASEHMVLVYVLQSDEAIFMSAAYCMMYKRMEARGYVYGKDWGYLIMMHDEWQIECREEIAEEVRALSEITIADSGKFFNILCPHEGKGVIGTNWYETH